MRRRRSPASSATTRGRGSTARRLWPPSNLNGVSSALNGLAFTALAQEDYLSALEYAGQCRRVCLGLGDPERAAVTLNPLGLALHELGRLDDAEAAFTEARRHLRDRASTSGEAAAVGNLALVAATRGSLVDARRLYLESLAMYRDLDLVPGLLIALDGLAAVLVAEGDTEAALRILTVVDRGWERAGTVTYNPNRAGRRLAARTAARTSLGPRAEEIVAAARGLSPRALTDGLLRSGSRAASPPSPSRTTDR